LNNTRAREAEIFAALAGQIGEASFNSWFRCAELHEPPDGSKAVVVAESAFMASYIRQHFGARLEDLLGRRIEVVAHGVRQSKVAKAERAGA
jgi:chromosomal replication initiation ATPase DnaA